MCVNLVTVVRSPCIIIQMGTKSNGKCLRQKRSRHRRKGHVKTQRDWSYVAIGQGSLGPLEVERGKEGFLPRAFGGRMALLTPCFFQSSKSFP